MYHFFVRFQQNQHIWKWWEGISKHKNMLAINSSYGGVWIRCPSLLPTSCVYYRNANKSLKAWPTVGRPSGAWIVWGALEASGKKLYGEEGSTIGVYSSNRASVVWGCGNNKKSKALVTQICLSMSSSRTGGEEAVHSGGSRLLPHSGKWETLAWHRVALKLWWQYQQGHPGVGSTCTWRIRSLFCGKKGSENL